MSPIPPPFAFLPPGSGAPGSMPGSLQAPTGAIPPPTPSGGPPPMPPGANGPSLPSAPGLPPGAIGSPMSPPGGMSAPPPPSPADMQYTTSTQSDGSILLHLLNADGTPGIVVDILQPPKSVLKQIGGGQSSPK